MGFGFRKTKAEVRQEIIKRLSSSLPSEASATLAEPHHSLSILSWLLLAFSLFYDALFLVDLLWALLCPVGSCFTHSELTTLGLLFGVNLLSTAAIACFLFGSRGSKEAGKGPKCPSLYLLLNGLALCLQIMALLVVYLFGEFLWTSSLTNAVLVLFYQVTFTSGNLLVYWLVWTHYGFRHHHHHQQTDFTGKEQPSSPSDDSARLRKDKTTPPREDSAATVIRLLCHSMAASGKQAATAMEHLVVKSMRLNLPGRLSPTRSSHSPTTRPPGSSQPEESIPKSISTE